jgi:golgi apparatus protein 1
MSTASVWPSWDADFGQILCGMLYPRFVNCRSLLDKMIEARSRDFRLDVHLREQCLVDINVLCGIESKSSQSTPNVDGKVIRCLQDFRHELSVPECQKAVHDTIKRASEDIRFQSTLADECQEDREKFCPNVQPVRSSSFL